MNTIKRFWALCLDTHMKLALYKYAIIINTCMLLLHIDYDRDMEVIDVSEYDYTAYMDYMDLAVH